MISVLKENKGLGCRWVGNFQFKERGAEGSKKAKRGLSLLFRQGEQRGAGIFFLKEKETVWLKGESIERGEKKGALCFFDY